GSCAASSAGRAPASCGSARRSGSARWRLALASLRVSSLWGWRRSALFCNLADKGESLLAQLRREAQNGVHGGREVDELCGGQLLQVIGLDIEFAQFVNLIGAVVQERQEKKAHAISEATKTSLK